MRKRKSVFRQVTFLIFLLVHLLFAPFASTVSFFSPSVVHAQTSGNTYYVATNGNNSNAGTETSPWRTIQYAANTMQAGDTAIIRGGTYAEQVTITRDGTSSQPITFRAYTGETPIIDASNSLYRNLELIGRSYIVFDGLRLEEPVDSWVRVENSHHITFQNMVFDNPTLQARAQGGVWMRYSQYNRILNSTFDNWGEYANGDNLGNAIFINNGSEGGYNLIEGNTFGRGANGDVLVGSSYNVVRNNTFNNPWQKGLSVTHFVNPGDEPPGTEWPANYNVVENNQFVFSDNSQYDHGGYGFTNNASNTIFRRNIVRNGVYAGVLMGTWGDAPTHRNNYIYNNTIVNNGAENGNGRGFWLGVGYVATNNDGVYLDLGQDRLKNNIIWGNRPNANNNPFQFSLEILGSTNNPPYAGYTIAGNLIENPRAAQCTPTSGNCPFIMVGSSPNTGSPVTLNTLNPNFYGNTEGNPRFVTYNTSTNSFDLHLTATSDAIDRGVALTTTTAAGSGTSLGVVDSGYFHDSMGGIIPGDTIQIGNEIVAIVSIDRSTNTLTIDRSISWAANAPVNTPYSGTGPDMGVFEFASAPTPTPTSTPEPTATPTTVPSPTPTEVLTPTPTEIPSPTVTPTLEPTPTTAPTATPTEQPTPTPTQVPEPTATPTLEPTSTPTLAPTPTEIPLPTPTPTEVPTPTELPTPTPTEVPTPEPTPTPTTVPTATPTEQPTPTATNTPSPTPTPTPSGTGLTYYVSTSGNNSNPGTQEQPWRTIQYAANTMQAGDTAIIRGGTYAEQVTPPRDGTASQPITFRAYTGETPIIDAGNSLYRNISLIGRSYLVFDGLRLEEPVDSWVRVENSHHITFQNMVFDNPTLQGRAQGGIWMRYSQYNRILNSTFDNWGQYQNGDNLGNMIFMNNGAEGGYNVIEGNTFGRSANGNVLVGSSHNLIRNNTFNNAWQKGLSITSFNDPGDEPAGTVWPAHYNVVEGNQFVYAENSQYGHGGYGFTNNSSHTIFRRNIIRNGVYGGLLVGTWGDAPEHRDNYFYNNTIVNNGAENGNGNGFWLGVGFSATNNDGVYPDLERDTLKNNIIWGNLPNAGNNPFQLSLEIFGNENTPPYAGYTIAGNLIENPRAAQCTPTSGNCPFIIVGSSPNTGSPATLNTLNTNFYGNREGNPRFVTYNPSGGQFDLRLTSTSDAIDQAVALTTTTTAGSGTVVTVADTGYFHDTMGGIVAGDLIQIGGEVVSVVSINRAANQITIDTSLSWVANAPVNLPYSGNAPDVGAFEYTGVAPSLTPSPTPSNTPTPSMTPTPTPTSAPLPPAYLSVASSGTIGGVGTEDEDILQLNRNTNQYTMYFDGSDVGLSAVNIDAFTILPNGHIIFSVNANVTLATVGAVTPQDLIEFTPTSTGSTTAGTFSWYFDGSDVALAAASENIDAVSVLSDGRVLISPTGVHTVTGLSAGEDEDLLAFTPTTLGATTAGTWSMYFDGSDVGLGDTANEDINSTYIGSAGQIYLSTLGVFNVTGVPNGQNEDVVTFLPTTLGNTTSGTYQSTLHFDGSAFGLTSFDVDGFQTL